MSLTMTAYFNACSEVRICFRRVVFPAPRNPEMTVTGSFLNADGEEGGAAVSSSGEGPRLICGATIRLPVRCPCK